jgi:hypothetical protein
MKKTNSLITKKNKSNYKSDEEKFALDKDELEFENQDPKLADLPNNKKYRINFNNITRIKDTKIKSKNHELKDSLYDNFDSEFPQTNNKKTHVIIISRKRNRISSGEVSDNDFSHSSLKKQKTVEQNHEYININKNNLNLQSHFDTYNNSTKSQKADSPQITILNSECNEYLPNLIHQLKLNSTDKNLIKNRNLKSFTKSDGKCEICSPSVQEEDNFYTNFYPMQANIDENQKIRPISTLNKLSYQLSEIRHLKFQQIRGIPIVYDKKSDFNLIENLYRKLYGDSKIIKITNDKIAILSQNISDVEKELKKASLKENPDLSYYIMQVDSEKIKNPNYIEECVNDYEKNNFQANDSQESEYKNENDSDSNREDNPNNDYPDEESDDNYDEEFQIYNTHKASKQKSYTSYENYMKKVEQKLNQNFIGINENIIMGYRPDYK